jgi:NADH dehydrogenase [ubiquinone] 1 alpha subcomplex assembly factor 6
MTVDDLTQHAESTSSTLFYALLSLLQLSSSSIYSHAASHLGIASTLAITLRGLPFHATKRRLFLPAELTAKHRISQEDVFRLGGNAEGIDDAVFELASMAHQHLSTARQMFEGGKVPQEALPVFLSAVSIVSCCTSTMLIASHRCQ